MAFLDEIKDWTERDAAVLALGRALGVFGAGTTLNDARAVLWTNDAAGNTLYGMLERLVWLRVLEQDEELQRYRAATPTLHPLSEMVDVPSLEAGAGRAHLQLSLEAPEGFRLEADRAGFRHLARVFDEVASSGVEPGWSFRRDARFAPAPAPAPAGGPQFTFTLVDPGADPDERG